MKSARSLLLASSLLGAAALPAQEDVAAVFAEANALFREGNELRASDPQRASELYRRAALRYENLLGERDLRNGKLYYNLGNVYFQLGDLGRAILNYRKAERLDPGDRNVQRNLEYSRTTRKDRLDPSGEGQVLETLLFWHYSFGPGTRTRLFAGAWLAFWLILLLRGLGKAWVPRELAIGFGGAALLLLGSLAYEVIVERGATAGVVVVPDTVARQGDGQTYEASFEDPLHAGAEFVVLEERPDWYRVELPDGRRCWLAARDVELVR